MDPLKHNTMIPWFVLGFALVASTYDIVPDVDENVLAKIGGKHVREALNEAKRVVPHFSTPQRRGAKSTPQSRQIERETKIFDVAVNSLSKDHGVSIEEARNRTLRQMMVQPDGFPDGVGMFQIFPQCTKQVMQCDTSSKFRTIDGTCNNLQDPMLGSSSRPFNRFVRPAYNDGVDEPRGGLELMPVNLPNARDLSRFLHSDVDRPDGRYTNMVMQFGQFLDHDLTLTPEEDLQCCRGSQNSSCFPILLPNEDPFFSTRRTPQFCLDFTRSTAFCPQAGGVREQMNALTSYVDGSQIYGSTRDKGRQLRQLRGGLLKTSNQFPNLLPSEQQVSGQRGDFSAGDARVTETPGLTAMHAVWMREHNRIARIISNLRPGLTDEQIYQRARRVVAAELENIVYDEFLPIVLGAQVMNQYRLALGTSYSSYDSSIDATILNSFATAAFRFGHTLINGLVQLFTRGRQVGSYRIRDTFFNARIIQNGGLDAMLEGLAIQNVQTYDNFVTDDVGNFLFRNSSDDFGSDLVARNIQRGRDHGIPGYNAFRRQCGLSSIPSMSSKPPEISSTLWSRLQQAYSSPEDIDLFVAGLCETPVTGGLVGPIFNCIIREQFFRLKFGDRFFFTHGNTAGRFTPQQFVALRNRGLSDVICDNTNIPQLQYNVFVASSLANPVIDCLNHNALDLTLFLD